MDFLRYLILINSYAVLQAYHLGLGKRWDYFADSKKRKI